MIELFGTLGTAIILLAGVAIYFGITFMGCKAIVEIVDNPNKK